MSSKKQRRRQAQRKEAEKPRFNPATLFMVLILAALLAVAFAAAIIDSDPGGGQPGQVWSPEHQHWH